MREDQELTYAEHLKAKESFAGIDTSLYVEESNLNFLNVEPTYNIIFSNNNGEVGRLDFNDGVLKFIGEADESAKIFFDFLANSFQQKIHDVAAEKAEQLFKDRIR